MRLQVDKLEERMTLLEEKLEFQDYTVEKLNDVLITQQNQIDELEHRLGVLQQKMDTFQTDSHSEDKTQRPPHY